MRHSFYLALAVLIMTGGCAGSTAVDYRVIPADQLPAELDDWKSLPLDSVDVRDAVIGNSTYFRIAVGPCPSRTMKVRDVSASGPHLMIKAAMAASGTAVQFPVVYLKTAWAYRTKWGPHTVTLQINDWVQTFWGDKPGQSAETMDRFRQQVTYESREPFRCVGP